MIRYLLALLAFLLASASAHASVVYVTTAAPEAKIKAAATSRDKMGALLLRGQGDHVDLDKLWHGLDWLLARHCARTTPCKVLMGGRKIGPDLGYGPASYYTPAEVRQLAKLLAAIEPGQLAASFDAQAMDRDNIYPNDWEEWERSGEQPLAMLQDAFMELRGFFERSAKAGHAVADVFY